MTRSCRATRRYLPWLPDSRCQPPEHAVELPYRRHPYPIRRCLFVQSWFFRLESFEHSLRRILSNGLSGIGVKKFGIAASWANIHLHRKPVLHPSGHKEPFRRFTTNDIGPKQWAVLVSAHRSIGRLSECHTTILSPGPLRPGRIGNFKLTLYRRQPCDRKTRPLTGICISWISSPFVAVASNRKCAAPKCKYGSAFVPLGVFDMARRGWKRRTCSVCLSL